MNLAPEQIPSCAHYRLDDTELPGSFSSCARNPISTFMATRSSASAALILTGSYSFLSMRSHNSIQRGSWCPVETMRPRISRLLCAHFVLSSVSHDTSGGSYEDLQARGVCGYQIAVACLADTVSSRPRRNPRSARSEGSQHSRGDLDTISQGQMNIVTVPPGLRRTLQH